MFKNLFVFLNCFIIMGNLLKAGEAERKERWVGNITTTTKRLIGYKYCHGKFVLKAF